MPQLVPRQDFSKAVTWSSGSFQLSSVAGPAASGALIALTRNPVWVYLLNGAAAFICLAMISFVRSRHVTAPREKMTLSNLIVGFEFEITRIEGKRKLNQNRSQADQNGVIAGLSAQADPLGLALASLMRERSSGV